MGDTYDPNGTPDDTYDPNGTLWRVMSNRRLSTTARTLYGLLYAYGAKAGARSGLVALNGDLQDVLGCSRGTLSRCRAELVEAGVMVMGDGTVKGRLCRTYSIPEEIS